MSKRFRVEGGSYGGEFTIGTVNKDFVEYIIKNEIISDDLVDYLVSKEIGEDPNNKSIPSPVENFTTWNEIDDIEHLNMATIDNGLKITEVPADGSDDFAEQDMSITIKPKIVDSTDFSLKNPNDIDNPIPVLIFFNQEKGDFPVWFLDIDDEDFDQNKLSITTIKSDLCEIFDCVLYNDEELEEEHDNAESTVKNRVAKVGYISKS